MPSALDLAIQGNLGDGSQASSLMQLLLREFLKSQGLEVDKRLQEFTNFSQDYLDKNPPVSQFFSGRGLGMTLQNGEQVVFNSQTSAREQATGVPITVQPVSPIRDYPQVEGAVSITK